MKLRRVLAACSFKCQHALVDELEDTNEVATAIGDVSTLQFQILCLMSSADAQRYMEKKSEELEKPLTGEITSPTLPSWFSRAC